MRRREIRDAKIGLFVGGIIGFLIVVSLLGMLDRWAVYCARNEQMIADNFR